MTDLLDTYKNQTKYKQCDDHLLESSIFDILENDFQIGDLVWVKKIDGFSWWPAFVYGCHSDSWRYTKIISKPELPMKKQYFVYCFGSHFKYGWIHQACLHRYEGLEEFLSYSESQIHRAKTKRIEERMRKNFNLQMPEDLQLLWTEALKEADEILTLPINLRRNSLDKIIHRFLIEPKYSVSQQGKEQVVSSDHFSTNEEQRAQSVNKKQSSQMLSSLYNLPIQTVSNNRTRSLRKPSCELIEKRRNTFSITSTRNEMESLSKTSTKSLLISPMNESDNDVVIVKLNPPTQSTSVSLTTAICHFLDKGIPYLTIYEELRLVNEMINHRKGSLFTLTDAQLYVEQYVIHIALKNFHHQMLFIQCDFFYDFLLKYPQLVLKHRQWFTDFQQTLMPINSDKIQLKKWQLGTLLQAHSNLEQCC